jgi:hypothetical protein
METDSNRLIATDVIEQDTPAIRVPTWLPTGATLEVGGVYVDLAAMKTAPFVALPGQVAGSGNRYLARRDVTFLRWNRLIEGADAYGRGTS